MRLVNQYGMNQCLAVLVVVHMHSGNAEVFHCAVSSRGNYKIYIENVNTEH